MKETWVLQNLKELAEQSNVKVYDVNLKKYAYWIKSGVCKVRGEYRIIIDNHLHLSEKIDVLIDALQQLDVNADALPPEVRRLVQKKGPALRESLLEQVEH